MSTAAAQLEAHLDGRYKTLTFQCCNCRPIAGTKFASQHSWPGGNARDIFGPVWLLDIVAAYLRAHRWLFGIKVILWRVKDHYDHVHVDMWPTGVPAPPCMGGSERYRYRNGRIVTGVNGKVPPEGVIPTVGSEATMIVRLNDAGPYVRVYQEALNSWAVKQAVADWTPLVADGQYGTATWKGVARYQDAAGLTGKVPEAGALDDLTRDLLERFIEA